ncbi:MAG: SIMPL domain-containing protein [Chromatiales bacterium]|jgi:predicted secreted protein
MRHRWLRAGFGFIALILTGPVLADLPGLGVVTFSVQAQREVEAQRMQVRMFAETSGARAEDVHQALALRVEAALKILRSAGLKGTTSGYNSRPLRDPGQATIRGWLGRYDLSWETDDARQGHEVLSKILAHMDVAGIGFAVSEQLRAEVTESLIAEALETFEQRAGGIAAALDRRGFSLGEVTISEQGGPPVVPMRATMAMAEAAPIEPGTTRLGVTVTGSIVLDPPTQ